MKANRFILLFLLLLPAGKSAAQRPRYTFTPEQYQIPFPKTVPNTPDTVSMAILGDVMMHSPQFTRDHRTFLERIAPTLREADFAVANMEFTLAGKPYSGYPTFSAPESFPWYVADECGVDVFLTANNHILDKGAYGIRRTLGIYEDIRDSLGVRQTGTGRDRAEMERDNPLLLSRKGVCIALVNFTYGTNLGIDQEWPKVNYMRKEEVSAAIRKARELGADFIIALPHWGTEYKLRHDAEQGRWAEWLASEGVDAVVGAHPHVVQDTTHINGVPVIYSLGNTVSNMSAPNTRIGLLATLRFVHDPVTGEKRMLEPQLDFLWCTLPGRLLPNSYATLFVKKWANRRNDWLTPSDFDNMLSTYRNVLNVTGIED